MNLAGNSHQANFQCDNAIGENQEGFYVQKSVKWKIALMWPTEKK